MSKNNQFGAFGGMISRSREVPKKYDKADISVNEEYIDSSIYTIKNDMISENIDPKEIINDNDYIKQRKIENYDGKLVFDTEGEVWTVDKKNEQTLPNNPYSNDKILSHDDVFQDHIYDEPILGQTITASPSIHSGVNYEFENVEVNRDITKSKLILNPKWDDDEPFNLDYASRLSDTEAIVVSKAIDREISPSDSELQALLQVGRPRLSQIFNRLNKAGILSVRKKGRSRLFKISETAKSYF